MIPDARRLPWIAAAVLLSPCSIPSQEEPPDPVEASERAIRAIREGGATDDLERRTEPEVIRAIAERLESGDPWQSAEDRKRAVIHFCRNAAAEQGDLLRALLRNEPVGVAYFAVLRLAAVADGDTLRRIGAELTQERNPSLQRRLLDVLGASRKEAAREEAGAAVPFLESGDPEVVKAALGTISEQRVGSATEKVLRLHNDGTEDREIEALCMRTLGRIWDTRSDARRPPDQEKPRLQALLAARMISLSPASTEEACEAFLLIQAPEEIESFLGQFVPEAFPARRLIVRAAGREGFDPAKGRRVHEAFLSSPDRRLVGEILLESPHDLDPERLKELLEDGKATGHPELPGDVTVAVCAAIRLERGGKKDPSLFPKTPEERAALLDRWKRER